MFIFQVNNPVIKTPLHLGDLMHPYYGHHSICQDIQLVSFYRFTGIHDVNNLVIACIEHAVCKLFMNTEIQYFKRN